MGVRTRLASCLHIHRCYFSRCLSRPPRSCSPSVFPSPSSPSYLPSPSTPPLCMLRTPSIYTVILEARHDARRLDTHRSRRLARSNRDSTSTTHLPSNCERAATAWCKIWTSNGRCRFSRRLPTIFQSIRTSLRPWPPTRADTTAACVVGSLFRHTATISTELRLLCSPS
jgi:hypothetical protein